MVDEWCDFSGDYCESCGRHYSEPCEDGCTCASCVRREREAIAAEAALDKVYQLRELDIAAGE